MRRDLELECDPAQLVLEPPDRSQLREMFRKFEFRGLLNRVDELDAAVPSAPLEVTGIEVPWREGVLDFRGVVGFAQDSERVKARPGNHESSTKMEPGHGAGWAAPAGGTRPGRTRG